jgi:hypothetical protein
LIEIGLLVFEKKISKDVYQYKLRHSPLWPIPLGIILTNLILHYVKKLSCKSDLSGPEIFSEDL